MSRRKLTAADEVRWIAGRKFLRRPDEVEVASRDEWLLVEVTGWSADGWTSLKLFRLKRGPKHLWQIGIKNGRASNNASAKLLEKYYPGILNWVIEETNKYLLNPELN